MVSMLSIVVCLISAIHLVTSDCVSVPNKKNNGNINPNCGKAEYQPYNGKIACEKEGCKWKPSAQHRIPGPQGQVGLKQSKPQSIAKPQTVLIQPNQKNMKKDSIHSKTKAKTKQENEWKQKLNEVYGFDFGPKRHIFAHDVANHNRDSTIRDYVKTLWHATTESGAKQMMTALNYNKGNGKKGVDPGLNILDPNKGSALIFGKGVYFAGSCVAAQAKTFGKKESITHCIEALVYVGTELVITEATPLRWGKTYNFKTLQQDGYDSIMAQMKTKYGGSMPVSGSLLGGTNAGFDPNKNYNSPKLLKKAEGWEWVVYNKDQVIIKNIKKINGGYFNKGFVEKFYGKKIEFQSTPAFNDYFVTLIFLAFAGVIGCCCCFIAGLFGGYFAANMPAIGVNDATKYFI